MAEYLSTTKKKITAPLYFEMKQKGEKISWLTLTTTLQLLSSMQEVLTQYLLATRPLMLPMEI